MNLLIFAMNFVPTLTNVNDNLSPQNLETVISQPIKKTMK
ncbi:hypothetical protein SALLE_v1c05790 [Spiroplasma alleghenense]|uniref:Uncharacterized protein n=1 Tax=Spiroplasma alleghenense TaxID=216931 RepID=A0A345Z3S2_9MOLU|nr:hypothetical protein SALLE_v1c05790 [Spiroplasma alleghenense]